MIHLCCLISLIGALPGDIRKHQIRIIPVLFCLITGIVWQLVTGSFSAADTITGIFPSLGCFVISKMFKDCIGKGDILLIFGVGVLTGVVFCLKFLSVSLISIFVYCAIMLMTGKIKRNTQVACVPFLVIGYIGAWFI